MVLRDQWLAMRGACPGKKVFVKVVLLALSCSLYLSVKRRSGKVKQDKNIILYKIFKSVFQMEKYYTYTYLYIYVLQSLNLGSVAIPIETGRYVRPIILATP